MAKITLSDPSSGFSSASTHRANNDALEVTLNEKVLYRDNPSGEANSMQNDLDMNSNRILNLPSATTSTEPVTLAQWTQNSAAVTIQFNGTVVETFTATEGQTAFTLAAYTYTPGVNNLQLYINGVKQAPGAYSETSTTVFTFTSGLEAGDVVEAVINQRVVDASTVPASSVTYSANTDRSVQSKLADTVSVKDFGATGDGSTDDTAAIQAAIDYLELNTPNIFSTYAAGGTVFFPAGVYQISSALTVNQDGIVLQGESRVSAVIRQETSNINSVYFGLGSPEDNERINGVGVKSLTFIYNGGNNPSANAHIWFDRARASIIDDCTLVNHYRGVVMAGVDEHCRFQNSIVIQGGNTTSLQADSSAVFVTRREVSSSDPNAVQDSADSLYYVRSGSVHFSNLQLVGNAYGMDHCIDVSAVDGLYMENSHIGWAINNVIRFRPAQSNLSIQNVFGSNLLLDNTSANIGDGSVQTKRGLLYQVNGSLGSQSTVINHYWSNCSFSGNDDKAVWVQDGWTTNLHDIRFSNCAFKNSDAEGVRLESGFDFDFSGCSFDANDTSGANGSRSHFYTDTNKVNLTGCRFSGTTHRGVYIDTDGDYVTGTNLQFFGTTNQPILINTSNDNSKFSNIVSDTSDSVVAAGTLFVPPELEHVYVTGTTTINSIKSSAGSAGNSAWEGRVITLIFDSTPTIGDGAGNMALAGGLSATAGDTLTLRYRAGTWYETARSVN